MKNAQLIYLGESLIRKDKDIGCWERPVEGGRGRRRGSPEQIYKKKAP